ncbi:MAG: tyrosine-type recombinase/integrase [bacterium]|nr:tyrosine-type recombinase/integrase [bacterium]
MTIAIDTGLRREEQFSLTWPQVDFRRGLIQTTARTKSGRARTVPLPDRITQILAQLKTSTGGRKPALKEDPGASPGMFPAMSHTTAMAEAARAC